MTSQEITERLKYTQKSIAKDCTLDGWAIGYSVGSLVEDDVFEEELVILDKPRLLYWALYLGFKKPMC